MGIPVKLSDHLIDQARAEAALSMRSIAGQVEYWARLGQGIERKLTMEQILLVRSTPQSSSEHEAFNAALQSVFAPDAVAKTQALLFAKSGGNPVYEAVPGRSDVVAQVHADGKRVIGKLVNRQFVAEN